MRVGWKQAFRGGCPEAQKYISFHKVCRKGHIPQQYEFKNVVDVRDNDLFFMQNSLDEQPEIETAWEC